MWQRIKPKLALALFALPFAAVGVGMLLVSVLPSLWEWQQMRSWQPVEAQVIEGGYRTQSDSDSTTYNAYARFRYEFAGMSYIGDRVAIASGSDNIGDFQQNLGRRLAGAKESNVPVTVWVNPEDPQQAIVDRQMRWSLLGFKMIFVLVFGGVGTGLLALAYFGASSELPNTDTSKPWLTRREWASSMVSCDGKAKLWVAWGFAGFWNLVSLPAGVAGVEAALSGKLVALVALLFPLVGVGLLVWAVKSTLAWRRFGRLQLHLDPYPGAIGGQVGGRIWLPVNYDAGQVFKVTLSCCNSYISGSGKNRRRTERNVWQSNGFAHTQSVRGGTELSFLFDVPDSLPESEVPADTYHLWRAYLEADLPGVDLGSTFEIPVFRTGQKALTLTASSLDHPAASEAHEEAIERALVIEQIPGGVAWRCPAFVNAGQKLTGAVIGAIFFGAGLFMMGTDASIVLKFAFLAVGGIVILTALYSLLVSLVVRIDDQYLVVQRFVVGIPVGAKRIARSELSGICAKMSYSAGSGGKTVEYFKLVAVGRGGYSRTVAFNIAGREAAQYLLESVSILAGLEVLPEKAMTSGRPL